MPTKRRLQTPYLYVLALAASLCFGGGPLELPETSSTDSDFEAKLTVPPTGGVLFDHGYAVVTGHLNGDEFLDWAVGYPESAEVRVFFGGLHRPYDDPVEPADAGLTEVSTPDPSEVRGPDLVIRGEAGSRFGASLAATDVEGIPALIIGAPYSASRSDLDQPGRAYVTTGFSSDICCETGCGPVSGTCAALDRTPSPSGLGDHYGWSVAAKDGLVAVGAPRWPSADGTEFIGAVDVFDLTCPSTESFVGEPSAGPPEEGRGQAVLKLKRRTRARRSITRSGASSLGGGLGVCPGPAQFLSGRTVTINDIGEELGESVAFCDFPAGDVTLAAGAIGADLVRGFSQASSFAPGSLWLDPDLDSEDALDRPQGLFGSDIVCGDFLTSDAEDEIAIAAVTRDWSADDYDPNDLLGPPSEAFQYGELRTNAGGVFVFDGPGGTPTRTIMPRFSGEYVGFSLAAGHFDTDTKDMLVVGAPRYENASAGAATCDQLGELDLNDTLTLAGGVFVVDVEELLEVATNPINPTILSEDSPSGAFLRHRIQGGPCEQLGGSVAIGDTNGDGHAEILAASDVDLNKSSLFGGNPRIGSVWLFSTLNTDVDDDARNVRDHDDDDDCFADSWEDKNGNGELDADETDPLEEDINALLQGFQLTCVDLAGQPVAQCAPGNRLRASLVLRRSCLEIPTTYTAQLLLRIRGDGASENLTFSTATFGPSAIDTSDPQELVIEWRFTDTSLELVSTAGQTFTAQIAIDDPVTSSFGSSLEAEARIEVFRDSGLTDHVKEARHTFPMAAAGIPMTIGDFDDNGTESVAQTISTETDVEIELVQPIDNPGVSPCVDGSGAVVACLPNAFLPAVARLANRGSLNVGANYRVTVPTDAQIDCPGPNPSACFPSSGQSLTCSDVDDTEPICTIGQELIGNHPLTPAETLGIEWVIRDNASAPSVSPAIRFQESGGGAPIDDPDPPTVNLALPELTVQATCDTPVCTPGNGVSLEVQLGNSGMAPALGSEVVIPIPSNVVCATAACFSGVGSGESVSCTTDGSELVCTVFESGASTDTTFNADFRFLEAGTEVDLGAIAYYPSEENTLFSASGSSTVPLARPDLTITSSCLNGGVPVDHCAPGHQIEHRIVVANSGGTGTGPGTISLTPPAGTQCLACAPAGCTFNVGSGSIECGISSVEATPAEVMIPLTVEDAVPAPAEIAATAFVYFDTIATAFLTRDATVTTPIDARFTGVSCSGSGGLCDIGGTVTYNLTFHNSADSPVSGQFRIPFASDELQCEPAAGCTCATDEVTCGFVAVPVNEDAAVSPVFTILSGANGATVTTQAVLEVPNDNPIAAFNASIDVESAPTVRITGTASVVEGDLDGTTGNPMETIVGLTLTLDGVDSIDPPVVVRYRAVATGTEPATAGTDFEIMGSMTDPRESTITITPPVTSASITDVIVLGDTVQEDNETFAVEIIEVTGGIKDPGNDVATVTIQDDDSVGVIVTPTSLTLVEGTTGSYMVRLASQPVGDVVVDVTSSDPSNGATVDMASLTFTTSNWSDPQTVMVTAVDDAVDEVDTHSATITHTIDMDGTADSDYDDLADIPMVSIAIEDNDTAGVTILGTFDVDPFTFELNEQDPEETATYMIRLDTQPPPGEDVVVRIESSDPINGASVNQSSLTFDSTNWDAPQPVVVTAENDAIVESDGTVTLSHTIDTALTEDSFYDSVSGIDSVTVVIFDDDGIGVVISPTTVSVSEDGVTDSYTVVLASEPQGTVVIDLDPEEPATGSGVTLSSTMLTFQNANWDDPQTVTVTAIDDDVDEGGNRTVTIDHSVNAGLTSDVDYASLGGLSSVDVLVADNDEAGVTVTESGGSTNVSESGLVDTYSLVLDTEPTGDVVIDIVSDTDTGVTLDTNLVTFTPDDWFVPQVISVTAVDDAVDEGATAVATISHSINLGSTVDSEYGAPVSIAPVAAIVADNDVAGVTVTESGGSTEVTEGGASDTYTLVLATEPTGDVVIDVVSSDVTTGVTVDMPTITFTPADWFTPQTITVTAVDDAVDEAVTLTVTIDHSINAATADTLYLGIGIADVEAIVTDNDP